MRKIKRFTFTLLATLLFCLTFLLASGCSVLEELGIGVKMEGTYKFSSLSYKQEGVTVEITAGEKFMGMYIIEEDFATITLNEDGTATMKLSTEATVEQGTWEKVNNDTVAITDSSGDCENLYCNGKILKYYMYEDGIIMELVLKK